jgi:TetR/AcrR family transcriptional regulator, cholesterol catabolism regulator
MGAIALSKTAGAAVTPEARIRLLRAAEKLFAEKGYAATSVQEITEAAEVNKALLYYYFEDKHTLYVSLIDDGVAEFRRMLNESLATSGSHTERLCVFIREHITLAWNRTTLIQVVHRCLMAGEDEQVKLQDKFQDNLDRLTAFLADGIAAGEFRAIDPEMTARSLLVLDINFVLCRIFRNEQDYGLEQIVDHVTDLVLHAIRS